MASRLTEVVVDCHDLELESRFWCALLGYEVVANGDGWLSIGPSGAETTDAQWRAAAQPPNLSFVVVPEDKVVKNRLHLDVTPVHATQAEEVARAIGLGASRVDIGQGDETWVVMADPEGNEFLRHDSAGGG